MTELLFTIPILSIYQKDYLLAEAEADEASAIKETGWRAWRQALISNGCNSDPSKRRFRPGRITSLLSDSLVSILVVLAC